MGRWCCGKPDTFGAPEARRTQFRFQSRRVTGPNMHNVLLRTRPVLCKSDRFAL
eukprot:CAMPEP_0181498670 /NCGR_PEP_ID=MMETSP1110-20121109/54228_1 /TAXON_ID=174948 /ORGANISM="Symbiodinium sp., Strain CCMP421" /LENGTH=53 /DNA_ID=CAMNT_0023626763 /DNA_START=38 /DNA_END=196 /DNA_ORIENTATION=+